MMWAIVQATLFRLSFHNWYGWRAKILRLFGAKIGNNLRIRRTATIEIPSNLVIGDDVIIGDGAILYALGTITLGDRVMISQYVHLCAGSHDHRYSTYPQTRPPVTIEKDCWVAAAAFIGPGGDCPPAHGSRCPGMRVQRYPGRCDHGRKSGQGDQDPGAGWRSANGSSGAGRSRDRCCRSTVRHGPLTRACGTDPIELLLHF